MKNIHILPTDEPSRLYKQTGVLLLDTISDISKDGISINQHIYITSDEEIKEGDWYYYFGHIINYECDEHTLTPNCKKIILTTDADLIKDGVQAIDDEFLEWFVKNPSCEEVELGIDLSKHNGQFQTKYGYKIIIPKEEPKQETIEEATIVAVRLSEHLDAKEQAMFVAGFEECIKWQHSQNKGLYNEEDLRKAYIVRKHGGSTQTYYDFDEWFNQFKNKTQ